METQTETLRDFSDATKEQREAALCALGLSLTSTFVPFSRSRNKAEKWESLNWRVVLSQKGRALVETSYGQGIAHCPAYHHPPKFENGKVDPYHQRRAIEDEIEHGQTAFVTSHGTVTRRGTIPGPSLLEVCYSLALDARSGQESFECFCSEFDYDSDSRKAEETWRACADIYRALGASLTESISRITEGY